MRLVCDSGSTKTDWIIAAQSSVITRFSTRGLNPSVMGTDRVGTTLQADLLPHLEGLEVTDVEFYGAGCTPDICPEMQQVLANLIPTARHILVASDVLGAAKAVCGNERGIAAILGTGANSCLFDGVKIVQNTPALGFILGDEGSGAVLGRLFLNALLKGLLPDSITKTFSEETGLTQKDIIEKVYRTAAPNRFLASMSPFIHRHLAVSELEGLVVTNFRDFFTHNIRQYDCPELPVNCVGSIAYFFSEQLREAAKLESFTVGKILRTPIDGLCAG
jgi:glucosamine kinase